MKATSNTAPNTFLSRLLEEYTSTHIYTNNAVTAGVTRHKLANRQYIYCYMPDITQTAILLLTHSH